MEDLFKNSLLGQLTEFGVKTNTGFDPLRNGVNPLAINLDGADINNSPFVDNPIKKEAVQNTVSKATVQKRLNDFDFDILQSSALKKAGEEFQGSNILGRFLHKYFPRIHKRFLVQRALNKLNGLNDNVKELVSKKIPYGESKQRYDALIEYLSSANTIHAKLVKKI